MTVRGPTSLTTNKETSAPVKKEVFYAYKKRAEAAKERAFNEASKKEIKSKKAFDKLNTFLVDNENFNPKTHMVRDDLTVVKINLVFHTFNRRARTSKVAQLVNNSDIAEFAHGSKKEADLSRFSKGVVKKELQDLYKKALPFIEAYHIAENKEFQKDSLDPIPERFLSSKSSLEKTAFWQAYAEPQYSGL